MYIVNEYNVRWETFVQWIDNLKYLKPVCVCLCDRCVALVDAVVEW